MGWLARLLSSRRLDRDIDRELQFHVAEEIARLEREGVPPVQARRQALAAFGGFDMIKEYTRDARGTRWVHDLGRDLHHAVRLMRRNPGFTAAAVLSLAIGIGANAAIFSVTDALLLRTLPVEHPEQLSFLNHAGYDEQNLRYSYPAFQRLQTAAPDAAVAAMSANARLQVMFEGGAEIAIGQLVSGNWFDVLGVDTAQGRLLSIADTRTLDDAPVVVLSHSYWTRRFAADPLVVGRSLNTNGINLTIVGVAADGFRGLRIGENTDVWLPVTMQQPLRYYGNASMHNAEPRKAWPPQDGIHWLTLTVRTPTGLEGRVFSALAAEHRRWIDERAAAASDAAAREYLQRDHLELVPGSRGLSSLRTSFAMPLQILTIAAALVLLIGCANLASLLLARGTARAREFALRASLGAGRARIIRQLLVESAVLAVAGGMAGLVAARWGADALLRIASASGRRLPIDVPLDWRFIGFTAAVSLLTGLAFGLMPALRLSRGDLAGSMKSGGRIAGVASNGRLPFGKVLVVIQVALSLVLLVGAVLFLRTFQNLLRVDTGLALEKVVSARFDPSLAQIPDDRLPALHARVLDRAATIPGVVRSALASNGAVSGSQSISDYAVDGQPPLPAGQSQARNDYVTDGFFDAVGMRLVAGRLFDSRDAPGSSEAAIVNQAFVRKFLSGGEALGRRIGYGLPATMTIVGIVEDTRIDGMRENVPPMVYHALGQYPDVSAHMAYIRVTEAAEPAKASLGKAISAAEPNLAVREVATLDELAERTISNERVISQLTGAFGLLAVLVASLGLFGTVSYSVARRTNEIGVRLTLGAEPARVRRLVLRETLLLVAIGIVVGLGLVAALMRYAATMLYGLSPYDPATLMAATAGLAAVGFLAGLVPAWRASRVDPLRAIRAE